MQWDQNQKVKMKDYSNLLTVDPHGYQSEGEKFLALHPYCILADQMGVGKTLQALIRAFKMANAGKKILVVVPPFLRINWYLEIDKMARNFYEVHMIEEGKELKTMPKTTDICIIGYSQINNSEHLFDWADCVIADEAHYLKSMDAGRTNKFHQFLYEYAPDYCYLLTGTPIQNGVCEFYSLLRLCSYNPRGTSGIDITKDYPLPEDFYQAFAYPYDVKVRSQKGSFYLTRYEGLRKDMIPKLKSLMKGKYIRRWAKDVLDLPPIVPKEIIVSYKSNSALEKEFATFNAEDKSSPPAKAKSALLKAPFTVDYAKNLNAQGVGPIIIYTDHVKSCEYIAEKLKCPYIHGKVSTKKRAEYVKQFQAGKLEYLVSTIGAGAEGLTLTAANHMILNDLNWVPLKNEQVYFRISRIGATKTSFIHFMIGSIQDKKITQNLNKKIKVIKEIL